MLWNSGERKNTAIRNLLLFLWLLLTLPSLLLPLLPPLLLLPPPLPPQNCITFRHIFNVKLPF
jgi:hypothetical protein